MEKKILIFIPTRNTAPTVEKTYNLIPAHIREKAEFIVVDNASADNSVEVARKLNLPVIRHDKDRGYGGSNKTAFDYARKIGADIFIVLHSDCQYDPSIMDRVLEPILKNEADVVFGSRILGKSALKGGMPWWKYISNRFLTWLENVSTHAQLSEYHTGYRIYTLPVLKKICYDLNSDNWIFDSEIIFQILNLGFRIKEVPIPTTYSGPISSISFGVGVIYGLSIFWLICKYKLHAWHIVRRQQFMENS
jgi:glycosyltransferase involved in cell wall biosynthesis